ncbi:hypothetical protein BD779DRAFT_531135 [Infundibulicybe gibba]|nr:hypothetical protein BD779DRAFT_531135 [Infundibulicybe gibba]
MSQDDASESGIFYLVPNRYGLGKTIVKRPRPPPTSVPLDDDFDAATQGGTTTRGPETEWGGRVRSRSPNKARSPAPLSEYFNPAYMTAPRTNVGNGHEPEWRQSGPSSRERMRPMSSDQPSGPGREAGSYGTGNYGDYGQYMDEGENAFIGSRTGADSSARTLGEEPGNQDVALTRRATTERIGRGVMVYGQPGRFEMGNSQPDGSGPKAGQSYEMVNHQILEDGPERTVTISTWREQVARDARSEEMSVYYLSADDYAQEHNTGTVTEVDSNLDRTRNTEQRGSGGSDPERNGRTSGDGNERIPTPPRRVSPGTYQSRPDDLRGIGSNGSGSPKSRTSPRTTAASQRFHSPPRNSRGYVEGSSPPRTSTPIRGDPQSPSRKQTPSRMMTPSRPRMSPALFHPTQPSGSTISSIRTASTIAFDNILASCEPPLMHIAPILAGLGITKPEHLRAVARLSEETRDREVKEEALRQGVTVMEWAILLDKLHEL